MSQSLTIDDREYISAREVGKHFGYTPDYIIALARDGKIDGRKIGHRWYANLESANTFFHTAKAEREARYRQISEERKQELRTHTFPYRTVMTEAAALVIVGVLVGVTGYLGASVQQASVLNSGASFIEELARSFYSFIAAPEPVTSPRPSETLAFLPTASTPPATTTYTSLVIGKDQVLTTTTVESIRDSFSDDVSVSIDPHNPDSGIIVPHFKSRDGEAYRFLMVPVTEEGDS